MKKIISLLSAFAMICTMLSTVAFAGENNKVVLTAANKTANSIDLQVSVKTEYADIQTIAIYFDMSDAVSKGATIKMTNGAASTSFNTAQKMAMIAFAPTDGSKYVSDTVLGTISVTGITENFDVKLKPISGRTATKISRAGAVEVTSEFIDATFSNSVTMKEDAKLEGAGGDMINPATGLKEKTYITGTLELAAGLENPVVEITDEEGVTKDFEAADWYPQVKGEGTVNVIAIVRYAGDTAKTFTLKLK